MSVYVPAEAAGTPVERRPRFLDWRFLAALTALLLVALLLGGAWRNYEIREAEATQKDRLIGQVESLQGQVESLTSRIVTLQDRGREDRLRAADERRAASRERAKLLRQQELMIRLLQRHGIAPRGSLAAASPRVTTSAPAPPTRARTTRDARGAGAVPSRSGGARAGSGGGSGATAPGPDRPTAGRSGKTPHGKAKGLRKSRGRP